MVAEPARAPLATLPRVHVEERPRHADDLILQTGLEEARPGIDALGQPGDIRPHIKSPVRHPVDADAHLLKAPEQELALCPEGMLNRLDLGAAMLHVEQRNRGALQRPARPAVQEAPRARDALDDRSEEHTSE